MQLGKTLSIPALAAALAFAAFAAPRAEPEPARFGNDPFIGEISLFAGNFAPRGWALCDGQLLAISSHSALFSILGTTYGGDGKTTFALPDLRGRVPLHPGTGPGLDPRKLGERTGAATTHLTVNQLPAHSHNLMAQSAPGSNNSPAGDVLATGTTRLYSPDPPDAVMNHAAIAATGGNQALSLMQPSLGVNFIIALQGTYPSRN